MKIIAGWLLTLFVETVFLFAAGYRDLKFLGYSVLCNTVTNLALNLSIATVTFTIGGKIPYISVIIYPVEIFVCFSEYRLYSIMKGKTKKLFRDTVIANALSYMLGIITFGHI